MRGRLAAALTAAVLFVPVAAAQAAGPSKAAPEPKCPASSDRLPDHCGDLKG